MRKWHTEQIWTNDSRHNARGQINRQTDIRWSRYSAVRTPKRRRSNKAQEKAWNTSWIYGLPLRNKKGSPYSITERRVPELIPVLGSQPAGDVRHKPGGRLPLLSTRSTVAPAILKRAATNSAAWWTEAQWVWTVCLRLTRQRHDCDLNQGSYAPEFSTQTTRLPSHSTAKYYSLFAILCRLSRCRLLKMTGDAVGRHCRLVYPGLKTRIFTWIELNWKAVFQLLWMSGWKNPASCDHIFILLTTLLF